MRKCSNPKCEDGEIIVNCRFVDCPVCDGTGVILDLPDEVLPLLVNAATT